MNTTNSLPVFANSLCLKFDGEIGKDKEDRAAAAHVLTSDKDVEILKLLREQTSVACLYVQLRNQKVQDEWKEKNNATK